MEAVAEAATPRRHPTIDSLLRRVAPTMLLTRPRHVMDHTHSQHRNERVLRDCWICYMRSDIDSIVCNNNLWSWLEFLCFASTLDVN